MNIKINNIILPNKPLSNFELEKAVKKLNINHFRGCFLRDQLPSKPHQLECGIINLDDFADNPPGNNGSHWCAWFIKNNENYYFDSFGLKPPLELIDYLGNNLDEINFNSFQFQKPGTVICGHLCLYILSQYQKLPFEQILSNLARPI